MIIYIKITWFRLITLCLIYFFCVEAATRVYLLTAEINQSVYSDLKIDTLNLFSQEKFQSQLNSPHYKCNRQKDYFGKPPEATIFSWLQKLELKSPHLPFVYLYQRLEKQHSVCGPIPCLYDLKISNGGVWQTFEADDVTVWLYSAYLDRRENVQQPTVRVYGATNVPEWKSKIFCQLWFEDRSSPVVTKVTSTFYLGFARNVKPQMDDGITPHTYMLNCILPKEVQNSIPVMVSLVQSKCDRASNALKVNYFALRENEVQKPVAVCVKNLQFPLLDISSKLIVWLELLKELGASKVYIYYMNVHKNVWSALKHYEKEGFVKTFYAPLPGHQPITWLHQQLYISHRSNSHIRLEKLVQNECFMRNIYQYKYVAVIDTDEIVVPAQDSDWPSLLHSFETSGIVNNFTSGVSFKHALYRENSIQKNELLIPEYYFPFTNTFRSATPIKYQMKTFLQTSLPLILSTHEPLKCLSRKGKSNTEVLCRNTLTISPVKMAHLAHFRSSCNEGLQQKKLCQEQRRKVVQDKGLLRFKDVVMKRVELARTQIYDKTLNIN